MKIYGSVYLTKLYIHVKLITERVPNIYEHVLKKIFMEDENV